MSGVIRMERKEEKGRGEGEKGRRYRKALSDEVNGTLFPSKALSQGGHSFLIDPSEPIQLNFWKDRGYFLNLYSLG